MKVSNILQSVLILCLMGCLNSCDWLEYHPYEGRIRGEKHLTEKNVREIETTCKGKTTFRFALISDTQRSYDDTNDAVDVINRRGDVDFIVHSGDMTDFGMTDEFEWMRDILSKLDKPYVTVIGNHDCLGNGEYIYQEIFGATNYAFTVGHSRIVVLNTSALEYDYASAIPDFEFMENEIKYLNDLNQTYPDSIISTIMVMHARPKDEQFNNNVLQAFEHYLYQFPGFGTDDPVITEQDVPADQSFRIGTRKHSLCLHGHNHSSGHKDIFDDGILYYSVANIHKREILFITIHPDGHDIEYTTF